MQKGSAKAAWGIGNILIYAVAKGITTFRAVQKNPGRFPGLVGSLEPTDTSAFCPYRVANIGRLYPYVPKDLTDIQMRFSEGSWDCYEDFAVGIVTGLIATVPSLTQIE